MTAETDGLRHRLRTARRSLSEADRRSAAQRLAEHLLALPELVGGGHLATYLAADGELDPDAALDGLLGRGWTAHLPTVGADRSMRFAEWRPHDVLTPNRYGIGEPPVRPDRPPRSADALDVVLVPCVGADGRGNRIGMGAGYYDRALAGARGRNGAPTGAPTVLIGIVHDDAVLEALTPEPWDVPLDLLVTDRRVVRPPGRSA